MKIPISDLKKHLLEGARFLDVRAPIEFEEGYIPGAENIPLLTNQERHEVGTTYKEKGKEAAISLGHALVHGETKEQRLSSWKNFFQQNPNGLLYCFRGGLRSQTVQAWLKDVGVDVPLIDGGYKAARQLFINYLDEMAESLNLLIVSGPTGSAKTHLVKEAQEFFPAVDLEGLANHKGSAFGFEATPQPSQANFENRLSLEIMKRVRSNWMLLEDESRLIGHRVVPEKMFNKLRESPIVWVDEPMEVRVENIFKDYITNSAIGKGDSAAALALFDRYDQSLQSISKRLGGLKTKEISFDLTMARQAYINRKNLDPNRIWIEKLLVHYYDPLYLGSLEKRQPQVSFKGTKKEVLGFLKEFRDNEFRFKKI
jgi:tRNA 2-selenouridine synthase